MNSRDNILARLRTGRPPRHMHQPEMPADRGIYRDYPQDQITEFRGKFSELNGELLEAGSLGLLAEKLQLLMAGMKNIILQNDAAIEQLAGKAAPEAGRTVLSTVAPDNDTFAAFDAGISRCEFLVARTGSIFLSTGSAGGRRLSVLPPVHIVLAGRNQLVASLDDVFSREWSKNLSASYGTLITGPSRTSDIEKQLVLGAHGPKRLILCLVDHLD
jgi:L-lactate dehydrogenase complex protein LldG